MKIYYLFVNIYWSIFKYFKSSRHEMFNSFNIATDLVTLNMQEIFILFKMIHNFCIKASSIFFAIIFAHSTRITSCILNTQMRANIFMVHIHRHAKTYRPIYTCEAAVVTCVLVSISSSRSCQVSRRPSFHCAMVALSECPMAIIWSAMRSAVATRSDPTDCVSRANSLNLSHRSWVQRHTYIIFYIAF